MLKRLMIECSPPSLARDRDHTCAASLPRIRSGLVMQQFSPPYITQHAHPPPTLPRPGHELNYFQDRLQRCSAACQDQARDSLQKATGGAQPNAAQQAALTKQVEACVGKCADTHIPLMKDVEGKLFAECKKRL